MTPELATTQNVLRLILQDRNISPQYRAALECQLCRQTITDEYRTRVEYVTRDLEQRADALLSISLKREWKFTYPGEPFPKERE